MGMPSKGDIFEHWKNWLSKNGFDWGEPSCWACGYRGDDKYDIKDPNATWEQIKNNWNRTPLQICHIIPRSLGGTDHVSNLFLMCKECHDLAPNTTSFDAFFKWVEKQSWMKRLNKKVQIELDSLGFIEDDYEDLINIIKSDEFKKWFSENTGLHFNQQGYGSKLTVSTMIAALWEYRNMINVIVPDPEQMSGIT